MAPSKSIWHNHSLTAARGKMFYFFSHQSPLLRARGIAFSTSWSAKCLWGSVWGAFLISALETCQGLRVSNQSCGLRRVTVRGRATGLLLPVRRVENYSSTRGEYLVLSKRPLEHFPPFRLTLHFHLQREALGVCRIIICSAFSFACVRGKGYFQLTPSCKPGMVLKSNRTPPTSRASHFHPRFSRPVPQRDFLSTPELPETSQGFRGQWDFWLLVSEMWIWYFDSCRTPTRNWHHAAPPDLSGEEFSSFLALLLVFPRSIRQKKGLTQHHKMKSLKAQRLSNRVWSTPWQNFFKTSLLHGIEAYVAQGIPVSSSWIFNLSHRKIWEGLWYGLIWKVYGIEENVTDAESYAPGQQGGGTNRTREAIL